jgi:hypothetical protein
MPRMEECETCAREEQSKKQTVVEIYEIGTGQMTYSLEQKFVVSSAGWSTNGNYLSVVSNKNRQSRIYQID